MEFSLNKPNLPKGIIEGVDSFKTSEKIRRSSQNLLFVDETYFDLKLWKLEYYGSFWGPYNCSHGRRLPVNEVCLSRVSQTPSLDSTTNRSSGHLEGGLLSDYNTIRLLYIPCYCRVTLLLRRTNVELLLVRGRRPSNCRMEQFDTSPFERKTRRRTKRRVLELYTGSHVFPRQTCFQSPDRSQDRSWKRKPLGILHSLHYYTLLRTPDDDTQTSWGLLLCQWYGNY